MKRFFNMVYLLFQQSRERENSPCTPEPVPNRRIATAAVEV
jgi:hypothetical protein